MSDFIKRHENKLMLNGNEILLKGICLGNNVWQNESLPLEHHNENDYKLIRDWGANVVRFYMHYSTFENDSNHFIYKEEGLKWLDQNINWAKENNIYLILSLYITQGYNKTHDGTCAFWTDLKYQDRIISLWKMIAERYKNETIIAGFDLIHEPQPPNEKDYLWKEFGNKIIDEIRSVDKNHLIIVQGIFKLIESNNSLNLDEKFILFDEENIMYEFHFFKPLEFSHQFAPWMPLINHSCSYPEEKNKNFSNCNYNYINKELDKIIKFMNENNVPLFCGEFGLIKFCYEHGKGGLNWINDVIDILNNNHIHYTYHSYHEKWFGLFYNEYGLPNNKSMNTKLIGLLNFKYKY